MCKEVSSWLWLRGLGERKQRLRSLSSKHSVSIQWIELHELQL